MPAALAPSIARGVQRVTEETVLKLAGEGENLCLAGGLFFNALLVESLERSGRWKNVFVQAAAGNAGTALGGVFHIFGINFAAAHAPARDSGFVIARLSFGAG